MPFDGKDFQTKQHANWRQALLDAADLLEKKGWIQGEYRNSHGYCAIGAISYATESNEQRRCALIRLAMYLSGSMASDIAIWNDTKGRTKAQVISALRAAAITQ